MLARVVELARQLREAGGSVFTIAKKVNLSLATVQRILSAVEVG